MPGERSKQREAAGREEMEQGREKEKVYGREEKGADKEETEIYWREPETPPSRPQCSSFHLESSLLLLRLEDAVS